MRNQAEVEKYVTGTSPFPEHPSEIQIRENPNFGPLDPPSHRTVSKPKRIKWIREEYKEVMKTLYQVYKEPRDYAAKQTYELWRQKVDKHRNYINVKKLANVRRDIMKNNRLTLAEIEETKMKIRQPINTE